MGIHCPDFGKLPRLILDMFKHPLEGSPADKLPKKE